MHTTEQLDRALAARYRIEGELGAGGMATVYAAEDVRHKRRVALKVLHPELSAVLGAERFLKEIELTANLQHPHILPLFDSGEADGQLYYVMPLVEGETLRARLERERQLPIADAVRIACEVADALAYAHDRGVVHRDIKPENILLQGGHALVADFGIALAVQHAGGQRMTQTGLSLGTPQYMSPEQAMGERQIDARSDVYALGAVLYEMLTGEPPFTGATAQAIVAKVLSEKPMPPHTVRDTVPPAVERAVLTALAKLPADRFASAAQFASAVSSIDSISDYEPARRSGAPSWRTRLRDPFVLGLGLAAAIAVVFAIVERRGRAADEPFPVRIELTSDSPTETAGPAGAAALSPDGHSVVYVGREPPRGTALYLRRLDQLTAKLIPGTENASSPVVSPDGKSVAFIVGRRSLATVSLDGGAPVVLADLGDDGGIDWSPSGDIVAGPGVMEGLKGLSRIKAAGGALQPFTRIDPARKELSHEYPRVLADGKTVLFTIWYGTIERSEIAMASLADGTVHPLGVLGAKALGVVDGQLVYVRADGVAMAVPFDVARRRVTGVPTQVQDSIQLASAAGNATASLTNRGGLVFAHGLENRRLEWVDRAGSARPASDDPREFAFVRLSPDGRRAAVTIGTNKPDIWILDLGTGALTRLTTSGNVRNPVWSSDGRRILYVSTQGGRSAFWWQSADGSGPPDEAGAAKHNPWNIDLAPDGHTVVFNAIYDGTFNLETFSLDATHEERDVSASPQAIETFGRFSPDGHTVAYQSDESGRAEVYVRSYPEGGGRLQISTTGGTRPVWSRDGKQLFYWKDGQLFVATLARDPTLRVATTQKLFEGPYDREFDVSPDGTRFLMLEKQTTGLGIVIVPDWRTELRRLTASRAN